MSRLINPGLGDYLDRLSILALKILDGSAAGKDVEHFERERNAILTKVRAEVDPASYLEWYSELAAVNAALWYATDRLRGNAQLLEVGDPHALCDWSTIAGIGIQILRLNDQRAMLVDKLNKLGGDTSGQEKL